MIEAVVTESVKRDAVVMDETTLEVMHELRDFMFERVYLRAAVEDQRVKAITIIRDLVDHYIAKPDLVPDTYRHADADATTRAIDYVAGMTDRFAIRAWESLQG